MLSRNVRLRFVNKYIEVPKRAKPHHPGNLRPCDDCLAIDLARLELEDTTLEQNKPMESLRHIERRKDQDDQAETDENLVFNEREQISSSPT